MTIKVLKLDRWMNEASWERYDETEYMLRTYTPIPPRFNRPGIYKSGEDCWFETAAGNAYKYDHKQFNFDLGILHGSELYDEAVQAIHILERHGLASKKLSNLAYWAEQWNIIKASRRSGLLGLRRLKILKRRQ